MLSSLPGVAEQWLRLLQPAEIGNGWISEARASRVIAVMLVLFQLDMQRSFMEVLRFPTLVLQRKGGGSHHRL